MNNEIVNAFEVLPTDQWRSATYGFVKEIVGTDVVVFTGLVDASALAELREECAAKGKPKPSWTSLVIRAISVSLTRHPLLNRLLIHGWYKHRPIQLKDVHAVVAVERVRNGEDTVYAQILRHTDQKPVWQISDELREASLVEEEVDQRLELFMRVIRKLPGPIARQILSLPRWSPKQWVQHRGGSFALTTVGKYGVDSVFVKWPWPMSFTFGEVKKRPIAVGDKVEARTSFYISLAWNRELTNGAPIARFFNDIVQYLTEAKLTDAERQELRQSTSEPG
jgi:pyruvate/2-oxoglutarate dehydrogenase complex dihydrolipoamide acyltransferase (E2) component